jgi:hypothetical protein
MSIQVGNFVAAETDLGDDFYSLVPTGRETMIGIGFTGPAGGVKLVLEFFALPFWDTEVDTNTLFRLLEEDGQGVPTPIVRTIPLTLSDGYGGVIFPFPTNQSMRKLVLKANLVGPKSPTVTLSGVGEARYR